MILHKKLSIGATAFVAAKRIYFGVGDGGDGLLKVLEELGGEGTTQWENGGTGVGRVILKVTKKTTHKFEKFQRTSLNPLYPNP